MGFMYIYIYMLIWVALRRHRLTFDCHVDQAAIGWIVVSKGTVCDSFETYHQEFFFERKTIDDAGSLIELPHSSGSSSRSSSSPPSSGSI